MIYNRWMSYIKDDVSLTHLVMPGAHNAGSYKMNAMACCQDGDLYKQANYGVRHFCIRMNTNRRGELVMSHGVAKGVVVKGALEGLRRAMDENPTEFFILDIREYYPQSFGPVKLISKAEPQEVNRLLDEILEPNKYALDDFDHISNVTMGDIRRSGKRFLIVNYRRAYKYSHKCECIFPWDKTIYGSKPERFVKEAPRFFDSYTTNGLYWFQTQQTPNFGTDNGLKSPRKLDRMVRPYFGEIIDAIAKNPVYLERANIISGDFMTEDYMKCGRILTLNLLKQNVREESAEEFEKALWLSAGQSAVKA